VRYLPKHRGRKPSEVTKRNHLKSSSMWSLEVAGSPCSGGLILPLPRKLSSPAYGTRLTRWETRR
jgi:hypothetical protein